MSLWTQAGYFHLLLLFPVYFIRNQNSLTSPKYFVFLLFSPWFSSWLVWTTQMTAFELQSNQLLLLLVRVFLMLTAPLWTNIYIYICIHIDIYIYICVYIYVYIYLLCTYRYMSASQRESRTRFLPLIAQQLMIFEKKWKHQYLLPVI